MKIHSVLDMEITDNNLGNYIIMQSVRKNLREIFPNDFFIKIPYLDDFGENAMGYMKQSQKIFVGGTNALSAEMDKFKQIGLNEENSKLLNNKLILCGVGWWQYQGKINSYTANILHNALSKEYIHSCRDSYTVKKLREIGIENAVNTGCPTIWDLDEKHCKQIPTDKADEVIIGFTDYNQRRTRDTQIMEIIEKEYKNIYCWVQSPADFKYVSSLSSAVKFIAPNLEALEEFLDEHKHVDYVGTRLHAGIKCIQRLKRSIIIGIDNRAIEMGKDFGLVVLPEKELNQLASMINAKWSTDIRIPQKEILQWKQQFLNEKK